MSWIMVDVESDGAIPGDYSMVCFGAVIVDDNLDKTVYGKTLPITNTFDPEALRISGFTRDDHEQFDDPKTVMEEFRDWIVTNSIGRPMFISDNNGYDYSFIHWYFIHFLGSDPFGHSSTNLGSLFKGLIKNMIPNFKHLRVTKHTHNPVDDAKGNAEAFIAMRDKFGLKIKF